MKRVFVSNINWAANMPSAAQDKSNIEKIIQEYKKYDNENTPLLHRALTLAERAINGR